MKKRGYKISVGVKDKMEIDFIAEKQNELLYIQVARFLSEEKTIKREFENLQKIPDNYRKIVLSMDKIFPSDYNGIEHHYLPDFLLNDYPYKVEIKVCKLPHIINSDISFEYNFLYTNELVYRIILFHFSLTFQPKTDRFSNLIRYDDSKKL